MVEEDLLSRQRWPSVVNQAWSLELTMSCKCPQRAVMLTMCCKC